ncbi:hypothetical protein [Tateyamaria sp.]|uniref:hypothetical protein n=1 Tax=Tateyamaria sp. TaxID=1929288 RepID=UPI0032A07068
MPRSVLITTSVLVLLAGVAGFWLGQRQVASDATGIINAVAARHIAEHGGLAADCIGWQEAGAAIFHVRCGDMSYHVDHFGIVSVAPENDI